MIVSFPVHHFRRHILITPTNLIYKAVWLYFAGVAKIAYFGIPLKIDEHIFWFKIAIDKPIMVEPSNSQTNLHKPQIFLPKSDCLKFFLNFRKKIPKWAQLHHKVNKLTIFKCIVQPDKLVARNLRQNDKLIDDVGKFSLLFTLHFIYPLHAMNLFAVDLPHKENFGKGSLTDLLLNLEIFI